MTSLPDNKEIVAFPVYLHATEIRRGWGKMIKFLKLGHPVFVLKHGLHVATFEPSVKSNMSE